FPELALLQRCRTRHPGARPRHGGDQQDAAAEAPVHAPRHGHGRRAAAASARRSAVAMGHGPETRYDGSCHCGAVRVSFTTTRALDELPLRECQCTFCRKHGARTTADPEGFAEIRVRDSGALVRYRFGLAVADYLVCARCGVYVAAVMEEAGKG